MCTSILLTLVVWFLLSTWPKKSGMSGDPPREPSELAKWLRREKNLRSEICKVLQGKQFLHFVNQWCDACEFRMAELKNNSYFVWPSKQLIKSGKVLIVVVNFAFTEREINSRTAFGAKLTSRVVVSECENCHLSREFWRPFSCVTSLTAVQLAVAR